MREAMLRVGIKFRSKGEQDVVGVIEVSACLNRQVVDDRNRTEATAVASKIPMKVALEETSMLPTAPTKEGADRRMAEERRAT